MSKAKNHHNIRLTFLFLLGFFSYAQAADDDDDDDAFKNPPCKYAEPLSDEDFSSEFGWLDEFHTSFSGALDDSALWLNEKFIDEEQQQVNRPGSKAWARVIVGWEPKEGDWSKVPLKFKVKVNLPNLKHKMNLVFSDNEAEDFNRLPLETSRPADDSLHGRDFGAAIQLLHKSTEHSYFRSRIGIGSAQLYVRTSHRWKRKFGDNLVWNIEPSLEYYMKDGAGYRFLTELSYFPDAKSEIRGFYSLWDREDFDTPRWKKAAFHLTKLDHKNTLITSILVNGVTSPDYRDEKITISTRWRRHTLRKWLFFELEPFVDFERKEDYDARWGIALRIGGFFGYN
jgi:hypothetical protein